MIKVTINIGEDKIHALSAMNTSYTGRPTIINQERLAACNGMEIPIEDIVHFDTEEDYIEFNRFLMGITAAAINYFLLVEQ